MNTTTNTTNPSKGSILIDRTGQRYGRLTVVERAENDRLGKTQWRCVCDCGAFATVRIDHLRSGDTKSCACLLLEIQEENARRKLVKEQLKAAQRRKRRRLAKERERERRRASRQRRRARGKQLIDDYKKAHPCVFCKEADPQRLVFHHANPSEKRARVSHMKWKPVTHIKTEMAKCVVMCAGCHNRLHNYARLLQASA
jgi:hypothetical protein